MKLTLSFFLLPIFIIALPAIAFSQDSLLSKNSRGIFNNGYWSVQFQESKYTNFVGTSDFTINIRKTITNSSAFRAGISILGLLNDNIDEVQFKSNNYADYSIDKTGTSQNGVQLFLQYIYYPVNEKSWNLYVAGGPTYLSFTGKINEYGYSVHPNSSDYYITTGNNSVWGAGALFSLGAEWIPYKNFGLTAEYGYLMAIAKNTLTYSTQHSSTPISNYANLKSSPVVQTSLSHLIIGLELYL